MKTLLLFGASLLFAGSAGCLRPRARTLPQTQVRPEEPKAFRLPEVPDTLTRPADRADYLTLHYWDRFDFADTTLIARSDITEQAFVDFLSVLPYAPAAAAAVDRLFERAGVDADMCCHFAALGEKYLYEPDSPMRDGELYILFLKAQIAAPSLPETEKIRPRLQLELALKNRPGDPAADFVYLGRDGLCRRMTQSAAEYTLLLFYDPECDDCRRVKSLLASSDLIGVLLAEGRLALLSVCAAGDTAAWRGMSVPEGWTDGCDRDERLMREGVYDLKALPTLYLLDGEHRVVLKEAPAERIVQHLAELQACACPKIDP